MNFALIVTSLAGGGAEKAMLNIATLLAARGHQVHLILLEDVIEHAVPASLHLHIAASPGGPPSHGWLGKRLAARRLARVWHQLNAAQRIDLSISTLPYCDEVVRLAAIPRVRYRIANTLSAEIDRLAARDAAKAARRMRRYRALYDKQALIAVSQGVAEDLRTRLQLSSDIATLYNPFDLERIRRQAGMAEAELPTRPYAIHVGRYAPQKRHDLLLDAWKIADLEKELVLLTEPDPGLARLIAERKLEHCVRVAGFRLNPYPWIAGAELLVLCSDHEGLPNVLVEALACGTRVLSTDCPSGPREVLRGELAQNLVPMNDAPALAAGMRAALQQARPQPHIDPAFEAGAVAARFEALAAGAR